jgi:hypothetical protein
MHRTPLLVAVSASIGVLGCAAVDGIKSKAADFSDMDASLSDPRGAEPFDGPSPRHAPAAGEGKGSGRAPLVSPREEAGPARPRPDGPTMDVYKTTSCVSALKAIASDAEVAPPTRALAGEVLRCDARDGRFDIRHAPCSLFPSASDDRAVDGSIAELRELAGTCRQPTG